VLNNTEGFHHLACYDRVTPPTAKREVSKQTTPTRDQGAGAVDALAVENALLEAKLKNLPRLLRATSPLKGRFGTRAEGEE
jgi:hypothetical protein